MANDVAKEKLIAEATKVVQLIGELVRLAIAKIKQDMKKDF